MVGCQIQATVGSPSNLCSSIAKHKGEEERDAFALTKSVRKKVIRVLRWVQQKDRELFPPDGFVDVDLSAIPIASIFHAPESRGSFYAITSHGIYRVVEVESGLRAELYDLTEERTMFVKSLIPGRDIAESGVREWLDVADFL